MSIVYRLKTDIAEDEDGVLHTVYGIEAIDDENRVIASCADVFFDKSTANQFIDLCNKEGLSLIHFFDVIEDALE